MDWRPLLIIVFGALHIAAATADHNDRYWLSPSSLVSRVVLKEDVALSAALGEASHAPHQARSKILKAGMVVELSHSGTGKGCDASSGICNSASVSVYRVVDGGAGYVGLIQGDAPFTGTVPDDAKLKVRDVGSSDQRSVAFQKYGKYCSGHHNTPMDCNTDSISRAEKFSIKCLSSCGAESPPSPPPPLSPPPPSPPPPSPPSLSPRPKASPSSTRAPTKAPIKIVTRTRRRRSTAPTRRRRQPPTVTTPSKAILASPPPPSPVATLENKATKTPSKAILASPPPPSPVATLENEATKRQQCPTGGWSTKRKRGQVSSGVGFYLQTGCCKPPQSGGHKTMKPVFKGYFDSTSGDPLAITDRKSVNKVVNKNQKWQLGQMQQCLKWPPIPYMARGLDRQAAGGDRRRRGLTEGSNAFKEHLKKIMALPDAELKTMLETTVRQGLAALRFEHLCLPQKKATTFGREHTAEDKNTICGFTGDVDGKTCVKKQQAFKLPSSNAQCNFDSKTRHAKVHALSPDACIIARYSGQTPYHARKGKFATRCRDWRDFSSLTECATCRCHDPCAFKENDSRRRTQAETCLEKPTLIDYRGQLENLIGDQLKKDYGLEPWKRSNSCQFYISHLHRKTARKGREKRVWLDRLSSVHVDSKKGGDKFRITMRIFKDERYYSMCLDEKQELDLYNKVSKVEYKGCFQLLFNCGCKKFAKARLLSLHECTAGIPPPRPYNAHRPSIRDKMLFCRTNDARAPGGEVRRRQNYRL